MNVSSLPYEPVLPLPIGTGGTSIAPLAQRCSCSFLTHSLQVEAAALCFYANLQAGSWTCQHPVHTLFYILGGLFGGLP